MSHPQLFNTVSDDFIGFHKGGIKNVVNFLDFHNKDVSCASGETGIKSKNI